jgi:DNA-directed RNA polymerase subunit E'/Rpb7
MGKKRSKDDGVVANADDCGENGSRSDKKRRKKESRKDRKGKERAANAHPSDSVDVSHGNDETIQLTGPESLSLPLTRSTSFFKPVFVEKSFSLSVALLPIDLRSTVAAVENSLRTSLLRYNDQLGGVLLAFRDVSLLDDGQGRILDDLPHIHYSVTCTALLFRPVIGCTLIGSVKESFPSHISVTVFHYFNASIPTDSLHESGFSYDPETLEWCTSDGIPVSSGSDVKFELSSLHESGGIISLEGATPAVVRG